MKEKRVDVSLAKAGFWQLLLIGSGGTFFTEFRKGDDMMWIIGSLLLASISTIMTYNFYKTASRKTKK